MSVASVSGLLLQPDRYWSFEADFDINIHCHRNQTPIHPRYIIDIVSFHINMEHKQTFHD